MISTVILGLYLLHITYCK